MSELDLLADCLKDATKERDELAAALVQKQTVIDEMLESLDEAKFTEPELRAKLDKQRHHIKRLKKEIDDFSDYRALKREQIARLQSQLADVASYESAALRKRIEQFEAALIEIGEQDLSTEGDLPGEGDYEYGYDEVVKLARKTLLPAGISEPKEDEPCPECHGTRKTVINKHIGVEDCPVCAQTVPDSES